MTETTEQQPTEASAPTFGADYLRSRGFSEEAIDYFDTHLADDALTKKMLARLSMVADELEAAGADGAISAAMLLGALDKCGAGSCAELPFALDQTTSRIIDGAQTKSALNAYCTTPDTRQAAAIVNTVRQICRQRTSYAWADETLREGSLKTYVQVSLSVIDDELARVSLALNDDLRFLPRLETKQALNADTEHQVVLVASLVLFWCEDGQVHCGMSERYGAGWAKVVRFARRRGYPIHEGFQGERIADDELEEMIEALEARKLV